MQIQGLLREKKVHSRTFSLDSAALQKLKPLHSIFHKKKPFLNKLLFKIKTNQRN